MAITSRQVGGGANVTSIPRTEAVAEGEVLLAFVNWAYDSAVGTVTMSGWTEVADGTTAGGDFDPGGKLFRRVATASEPSSYATSASANLSAVIVASTGVDTADPIAGVTAYTAGGRASGSAPSLTPDDAPCRVFWSMSIQNYQASPPGVSWTGVDGEAGELLTDWLHISVAYEDRGDISATGTRGWSISPYGGNTDGMNIAVALREGSSGPPPAELVVDDARAVTRATQPLLSATAPSMPPPEFAGRSSSSRWKFILGPASGGWLWEIADAKMRRVTLRRRAPSSATFAMRGDHPLAERVVELGTDLHLLRENRDGLVEQLYRGRVGGTSDELGDTGHVLNVPTLDYRGVLERRHLMSGSQVVWTGFDQHWIAYGLITQAQNKPGGDYGIANAMTPSGVVRDRTYELGDSIGQRIQELSEVENGFDWDIVPQGASGLNFTAWRPERGENRGVILEYGGLVKSLSRNVDSSNYANAVRVTGQPPEGSSTPPPPHEGVATGIEDELLFPQGRWDKVVGTSIVLTGTLAERRTWLLDHHQVIRPSYTVRLRRGAWDGPSHIGLGDQVRLVIVSGRLKVDTVIRVEEIDIAITDSGAEDVTLTLGAPRPDFARRAAANEKRIEELERR